MLRLRFSGGTIEPSGFPPEKSSRKVPMIWKCNKQNRNCVGPTTELPKPELRIIKENCFRSIFIHSQLIPQTDINSSLQFVGDVLNRNAWRESPQKTNRPQQSDVVKPQKTIRGCASLKIIIRGNLEVHCSTWTEQLRFTRYILGQHVIGTTFNCSKV
jgi:hypothetical protein